jgi:hypothetical protein
VSSDVRWASLNVDACGATVHNAYVEAAPPAWTIWLPCALAFLWSIFLIFIEFFLALYSNFTDSTPPPMGWVYPAIYGHCVLAGASVLALVVGLRYPSRRRAAAITAWLIIPVALGWLVLIANLLGGS